MSLFPVPVEEFGGLNLVDDPGEIGWDAAIDLLNIDFDHRGRLRSRDGWTQFVSESGTSTFANLAVLEGETLATAPTILGSTNNTSAPVIAYDATGVRLAFHPSTTGTKAHFAHLGGNIAPGIYIGTGKDKLSKWDGSSFTTGIANTPKARFLAVQSPDDRLVGAGFLTTDGGPTGGAGTSYPSRVYFSNPGDPTTWGTNNWVDLDPGDGEAIQGLASWNNLLFAFKRSKFFVFYGNTTDTSGNPVFNYRRLGGRVGMISERAVTVAPDGVYFAHQTGVYKTVGGPAVRVSGPIDPLFTGSAPTFFTSLDRINLSNDVVLGYYANRLFMSYLGAVRGAAGTFVYDVERDRWTYWEGMSAYGFATFKDTTNNREDLLFSVYVSGGGFSRQIGRFSYLNPATDDHGAAITSYYQSGFSSLSYPGRSMMHYTYGQVRKKIRKWKATGSGTVSLSVAHDFGSQGTASSLTLGTSPAIKDGWHNIASRGKNFSYRLSSTSPWTVNSLDAYLAGSEPVLLGNPSDG